ASITYPSANQVPRSISAQRLEQNGRYLALSVSLPQIGHLCTLTTLPALTALSAAFEIGEPAVQTAVSDAEQGAAADVDASGDAAGDTGRFSADISGVRDLSILWLHASG